MCRWGCAGVSSTYMCKWCGTRYCKECMHGEFTGTMKEETRCAKCNQPKCQGKKVEAILKEYIKDDEGGGKRGAKSAGSSRSRSASPSKKSKSAGGSKKSAKGKSKKSGKKKKGSKK
ncbi:uncharacterized protein LOC101846807 [Aplysia californica]|uniref:Uncharacterized protein LOC101846807 n=1 Tax=Aplysia californica TaxID=6500 RepID=A0ABM0JKJ9_APLCA|nr:uncharacterized protein LOC101846807 [Aplysia californica]